MSTDLQSRITGTWTLQSYSHYPVTSPSEKTYPLTPNALGTIIYSPDGYMAAQVVRPGQAPFPDGGGILPDTSGTPADWEQVGRNFIAYSGRFWVEESEGKEWVWHELSVCSLPGMVGKKARRSVEMEGEGGEVVLRLGVEGLEVEGVERRVEVVWRKVGGK